MNKRVYLFLWVSLFSLSVLAQISPEEAGFLDVTKYGATPDDSSDCDAHSIQAAIDDAVEKKMGVFFPAGDYHLEKGLKVDKCKSRDDTRTISGSTIDPHKRSRIILKKNSIDFQEEQKPEAVILSVDIRGYTNTFMRQLKHLDFVIEEENDGAVAVSWQGAEGMGIYDVNVDLTKGGFKGFWGMPGSGGSTHDISVKGGKIAVDMRGSFPHITGDGAQPSPMISGGSFEGQTECAIIGHYRGTLVLVGCMFVLNPGVILQKEIEANWLSTGSLGGLPVYVDCSVEFSEFSEKNNLFTFAEYPNGFAFDNVYLKNVNSIIEGFQVPQTKDWLFYTSLAYDVPVNQKTDNETVRQGVFLNGNLISEDKLWHIEPIFLDSIPFDLHSKHRLPQPFPFFESEGVVSINDYKHLVTKDGDWTVAFKKSIEEDKNELVWLPPGNYKVRKTIFLNSNTKLMGMNSRNTFIYGTSEGNPFFDNSKDPYNDPRPVIATPDDKNAHILISDIGIRVALPHDNIKNNPHPVGLYSLLWQSGRNSIVKNLDTDQFDTVLFRHHNALDTLSKMSISLAEVDSGYIENGFVFSSDCAANFFNHQRISSKILVETHNYNKRLVTRSMDKRHNSATIFDIPNIVITSNYGKPFNLKSIEVGQAHWNPKGGSDVKIVKIIDGNRTDSLIINYIGQNKPREILDKVELNWKKVTAVEITSSVAFSIDNVNDGKVVATFNDLNPQTLTYDTWETAPNFRHLPIGPIIPATVLIKGNGGGRWYNFARHGNQWLDFETPYIKVEKNLEPLAFYHLHVQHSQNDVKVVLNNVSNVNIYGVKVENCRTILRAYNSYNFNIYGHGGMTNAIPGHNQYYFENCTNYKLVSLAEQLWEVNSPGKNYWNYLVKTKFSEALYDPIIDIRGKHNRIAPKYYRPLWWEVKED